jgi:MFS family permease
MALAVSSTSFDTESTEAPKVISIEKWIMSAAYMLAMGVCGIVLVAIGSTFEDLAQKVHRQTTSIGSVFIARGAGSVFGAILCSKLYKWFPGNFVMFVSLLGITLALILTPFVGSVTQLHASFFFLGLGSAVTDTGCQLMTRKLHGKRAGPWLGANATVFGLSAAFVPILELISTELLAQYFFLASIVAVSSLLILYASRLQSLQNLESHPIALGMLDSDDINEKREDISVPHYYSEMVISIMLFCFVGGCVSATAYIESYIDQTGVISTYQKGYLIFVLWMSITIGRVVGVQDQRSLTDTGLTKHLTLLCLGGFLSMTIIFIFPGNSFVFWTGIASYGIFHGPTIGFTQDLNNRLTLTTEKSMAIVMFGLNCGASFVPYLATILWSINGNTPLVLVIVIGFSMLIPLPLLYVAKFASYGELRQECRAGFHDYESITEEKATRC